MAVEPTSDLLRSVTELQPVARGEALVAKGDRGPAVKAMQQGLVALGYALAGGADGIFGNSTEAGLRDFRSLHFLEGAAILDPTTLAALDKALARLQRTKGYQAKNPRFTGDAAIAKVLDGSAPLPAHAPAVTKIQQALLDLMFALPRWGADGDFGDETRAALRAFQRWQRIRPGGELSPLTMLALDEAAPAPGTVAIRHPEYATMMRDGMLTVTLALGYDEAGNDLSALEYVLSELRADGFAEAAPNAADPVRSFTCPLAIAGSQGTLRLRLVHRTTPHPEQCFAEGLVHDAVTIYTGHARYGTGPDFDPKESTAENFVIGVGSPQHARGQLQRGYDPHMNEILAGVPNDLLATRFDPQLDQLWVFLGCTTQNYLDELRALVGGKDTYNLDLLVSTRPMYWRDSGFLAIAMIRGLRRGASINEVVQALNERAVATEVELADTHEGPMFITDGFGDNGPL